MVVMFRPPTTTQHCQPIFTASTDCVSIADRRSVCVMCTQLHSCWGTMDGWWFQWLRWLVVPVGGQDWELCVGVFMRGGEWFCLRPVWSASSFSSCLLHTHYQSSFCCEMRSRLRKSTNSSATFYRKLCFLSCDGIDQEFGWLFDSLKLTSSLDWGVMIIPRNTFFFWVCQFSVWVFAISFHSSRVKCAGVFMWYRSGDKISLGGFDCVTLWFFIFSLDNVQ